MLLQYMQIAIQMTNGVSFSLVDGAIIFVKFTNAINRNIEQGTTVTLNVNSLGPKTLGPWSGGIDWGDGRLGPGYVTNSNQHYPIIYVGSDYRIVSGEPYYVSYGDS